MRITVLAAILIFSCTAAYASVTKEEVLKTVETVVREGGASNEVFGTVIEDESAWPAGAEAYKGGKVWLVVVNYEGLGQKNENWWIDRETGAPLPQPSGAPAVIVTLHSAAKEGDVKQVETLLAQGVDVDSLNSNGDTALGWASDENHPEIVELLLAKGAKINTKGSDGWTALHYASKLGNDNIVEILLAKGADMEVKNKDGWTALHTAVHDDRKDVVKRLIAKGADVNAQNVGGWTPLHVAANQGNAELATYLLAHGANSNIKDQEGETPEQLASKTDQKDVAEILSKK